MTYNEFIQNILDTRGRFGIPKGEYKERHHITPRCIGGTNDEDNLIDLYADEHFEAHKMLALENPNNSKLAFAFWCMCSLGAKNNNNCNEYEQSRRIRANINISETTRKKLSESHKGKKRSQETKDKQSASMKGKNTQKHSYERRKAQSERMTGIKREYLSFAGKHHTNDTKLKISNSNKGKKHNIIITDELRAAYGDATRGAHWYNNGIIQIRCKDGEQPYNFIKGRLNIIRDNIGRFKKRES